MLLEINDFGQKDVFSSTNVFSEEDFVKKGAQDLIRKNWNEICYVHEDYDIHDVNYELKAVGLPSNSFFTSCSMGFVIGADIEILQFEKKYRTRYKQSQKRNWGICRKNKTSAINYDERVHKYFRNK